MGYTICGFASLGATRADWVPGQAPVGPVLPSRTLQSLSKWDDVFQAHLASLPTFSLLTHRTTDEEHFGNSMVGRMAEALDLVLEALHRLFRMERHGERDLKAFCFMKTQLCHREFRADRSEAFPTLALCPGA